MKDVLYLDDVKVGDIFTSREYLVTKDEMLEYANKYDPQVFHTDEELAKDTFFRGLAASGWMTVSITMRLVVETINLSEGVIGAGATVDWPTPTREGDILTAKMEIKKINISESKPNQGLVSVEITATNQEDKVRLVLTPIVLMFKK